MRDTHTPEHKQIIVDNMTYGCLRFVLGVHRYCKRKNTALPHRAIAIDRIYKVKETKEIGNCRSRKIIQTSSHRIELQNCLKNRHELISRESPL